MWRVRAALIQRPQSSQFAKGQKMPASDEHEPARQRTPGMRDSPAGTNVGAVTDVGDLACSLKQAITDVPLHWLD